MVCLKLTFGVTFKSLRTTIGNSGEPADTEARTSRMKGKHLGDELYGL
jgi:hypothetical protein